MIDKVSKGVYRWRGLERSVKMIEELEDFESLNDEVLDDRSLGMMTVCYLSLMKTYKKIKYDKIID